MLRYASEREKANHILNLTSLTVEQFEQLVEPFEQAFVRHMRQWIMEGKPRTRVPIPRISIRHCPHPKTACCSCLLPESCLASSCTCRLVRHDPAECQ